MSFRTTLALNVAPLCLRLALASTFIWAGVSKVAYRTPVSDPNDIAVLVEWGQIGPESAAIPAPPLDNPEEVQPEPEVIPTEKTIPETVRDLILENEPVLTPPPVDDQPAEDIAPEEPIEETQPPADDLPPEDPAATDDEVAPVEDGSNAMPVAFQVQANSANAQPVEVKRVMGLALSLHHAANPGVDDQGQALMPLWPDALAKGTLPVVFAWVAAILELVCGAAMLIGFFTRLAALPLAGTMLAAMWLTQIGPAIQSGSAVLGFLPPGMFEMGASGPVYTAILWQFALLMSALAIFLMGPGALSIDRLIFGGPSSRYDETGSKRQVEFVPMSDA